MKRKSILNFHEIRRRRERLKLTQEEAAERAGFGGGRQTWNDLEKGRRTNITLDTLWEIAEALDCAATELLTDRARR